MIVVISDSTRNLIQSYLGSTELPAPTGINDTYLRNWLLILPVSIMISHINKKWEMGKSYLIWYGKTWVASCELRVESLKARVESIKARVKIQKCEFRSTSYEFKSKSYEFKFTSCKFKSTSYEFKSTSYEFRSTSYEFIFTSYEFKSTSSRIVKSMKTKINSLQVFTRN